MSPFRFCVLESEAPIGLSSRLNWLSDSVSYWSFLYTSLWLLMKDVVLTTGVVTFEEVAQPTDVAKDGWYIFLSSETSTKVSFYRAVTLPLSSFYVDG